MPLPLSGLRGDDKATHFPPTDSEHLGRFLPALPLSVWPASCLAASRPLASLLLLLLASPACSPSRYAFADSATDADLILLLEGLMRLPHQPHAHRAALTVTLHLCASGFEARRFLVRCSLIEPLQGLLDEYPGGRLRLAAEEVLRQLTQTVLVEMEAEEEEGRLTAAGRQAIESKALRGLARALVE